MSPNYFRVISGARKGLIGNLLRLVLGTLAIPYGCATALRNRLYDLKLFSIHRVSVPVVSLGNLTTGGTGKTPVAAFLAQALTRRGCAPAIVSRGYRADASGMNDETLVLEYLCPGVRQIRNRDRVAGAREAISQGAQAILLDDGYQHRRLARDVNILLIDALNPWGYGNLLPRGLLRESLRGIRRADLVLITRANLVSRESIAAIRKTVLRWAGEVHFVEVAFESQGLINHSGEFLPLEELQGVSCAAFCGIGNPEGFWQTLERSGVHVPQSGRLTFPDHHHYDAADLKRIGKWSRGEAGSDVLLTTLKDLVKIQADALEGTRLWGLKTGVRLLEGEDSWERMLTQVLEHKPSFPGS